MESARAFVYFPNFQLPSVPERNDVLHGVSPQVFAVYLDYHARETYDVIVQTVRVSSAQAERVASLAKAYGAVPKAQCSVAINRVLKSVPGFEVMEVTYYPNTTRKRFGMLPGVRTRMISDDDPDRNEDVLLRASGG